MYHPMDATIRWRAARGVTLRPAGLPTRPFPPSRHHVIHVIRRRVSNFRCTTSVERRRGECSAWCIVSSTYRCARTATALCRCQPVLACCELLQNCLSSVSGEIELAHTDHSHTPIVHSATQLNNRYTVQDSVRYYSRDNFVIRTHQSETA